MLTGCDARDGYAQRGPFRRAFPRALVFRFTLPTYTAAVHILMPAVTFGCGTCWLFSDLRSAVHSLSRRPRHCYYHRHLLLRGCIRGFGLPPPRAAWYRGLYHCSTRNARSLCAVTLLWRYRGLPGCCFSRTSRHSTINRILRHAPSFAMVCGLQRAALPFAHLIIPRRIHLLRFSGLHGSSRIHVRCVRVPFSTRSSRLRLFLSRSHFHFTRLCRGCVPRL